jgi:hypothetical protein
MLQLRFDFAQRELFLFQRQYRHKRILRNFHVTDHLETLLTLLLFSSNFFLRVMSLP